MSRAGTVAVTIVCKTPEPGRSKTRLSPPLHADECAALSACFIRDLASTIDAMLDDADDVTGVALYTPVGSEPALRALLPARFEIHPQEGDGFGERLWCGARDLLDRCSGVLLINSDSPTLPAAILRAAADAVLARDCVALSPAHDGGYTLIGLSRPHRALFEDMPWSTPAVHRLTVERAASLGLPVVDVPGWYDVDDAASLAMLVDELAGTRPSFAQLDGAPAAATRRFLADRVATAR